MGVRTNAIAVGTVQARGEEHGGEHTIRYSGRGIAVETMRARGEEEHGGENKHYCCWDSASSRRGTARCMMLGARPTTAYSLSIRIFYTTRRKLTSLMAALLLALQLQPTLFSPSTHPE
jgi:hypothetical protein